MANSGRKKPEPKGEITVCGDAHKSGKPEHDMPRAPRQAANEAAAKQGIIVRTKCARVLSRRMPVWPGASIALSVAQEWSIAVYLCTPKRRSCSLASARRRKICSRSATSLRI